MTVANLFDELVVGSAESFTTLVQSNGLKLERIVSSGQATPVGSWYHQDHDEWVVVLKGSAGLLFEHDTSPLTLHAGDHVTIPAHARHRVEWTDPDQPTVWLALHYG